MSPHSKNSSVAELWLPKHIASNNHRAKAPSSTPKKTPPPEDDKSSSDDDIFPNIPDSPSVANASTGTQSVVEILPVNSSTDLLAYPIYAQTITDFTCIVLMNESQQSFFRYEKLHKGLGFANIVKKAFGVTAKAELLGRDEIAFHLDLCSLCVDLTRSQLQSVGSVIENVVAYYTESISRRAIDFDSLIRSTQNMLTISNTNVLSSKQIAVLKECYESLVLQPIIGQSIQRGVFKETKPAITYAEIDRRYLKGTNAIYKSLPIPTVYLTDNGSHAYLRVPQVVASFLASGICDLSVPAPLEFANSDIVESYYTSTVAREVYANCHSVALMEMGNDTVGQCFSLHFKDWADDAQKNNVRSNSTSYNIRTVTFMKHGENGDVRYYSYVISLSVKGSDHEEVEKIFNEDLKTLSKPNLFFSGYHNEKFWAIVNLVAGVRDRPARGETFHLGNHGHMFGKRFRYAAFHDKRQPIMPCDICHASRILRLRKKRYVSKSSSVTCDICADLDYESSLLSVTAEYISKSTTKPGEASSTVKYPTSLVPESPQPHVLRPVSGNEALIAPIKVTFDLLIKVCEVAFFNYHYLIHIRERRKRARTTADRNSVGRAVGWTQKEFKTYIKSAGANEYICQKLMTFSSSNVNSHPSELLSELRTKIIPSTWQRLGCSMSHQLDAVFHLVFHGISMDVWDIFLNIMSSLKIGGNVTLKSTFKKALSGLLDQLHDLHLIDMPILPFAKGASDFSHAGWVGSNKMAFCMVMPYIVSHVRYFFRTEAGREMNSEEENRILHIQMALYSFYCANVILLQRSTTTEQASLVGDYIKVFLYEITEAQKSYITKPENLSYLTTGNFLSMLNLEENLSMFGPLRFFWDALDEKNVQKVKRAWPNVNMSSSRWLASLLENVTREQHLNLLWKNTAIMTNKDDVTTKRQHDNIHIMQSEDTDFYIASNAPFSALYSTESKKFYVVVRKGGQRSGKLFTRAGAVKKIPIGNIGSCQYYKYRVEKQEVICNSDASFAIFCNHKPVVFLPFQYLENDIVSTKKQIATIVALEDHKVFYDYEFVIPSISEGDVEGQSNIDEEDFQPDDDGMVAV